MVSVSEGMGLKELVDIRIGGAICEPESQGTTIKDLDLTSQGIGLRVAHDNTKDIRNVTSAGRAGLHDTVRRIPVDNLTRLDIGGAIQGNVKVRDAQQIFTLLKHILFSLGDPFFS